MVIEFNLYGFGTASCSNEIAYVCEENSPSQLTFLLRMLIFITRNFIFEQRNKQMGDEIHKNKKNVLSYRAESSVLRVFSR
jgi:hypothetical protein